MTALLMEAYGRLIKIVVLSFRCIRKWWRSDIDTSHIFRLDTVSI